MSSMRFTNTAKKLSSKQHGAALLVALFTVALIMSLSVTVFWMQERQIQLETHERTHVKIEMLLNGVYDWLLEILQQDASSPQGSNVDHLNESWANGIQKTSLVNFYDSKIENDQSLNAAFISGSIIDAQARLNLLNLIYENKINPKELNIWRRLFEILNLPTSELEILINQILKISNYNEVQMKGNTGNYILLNNQIPLLPVSSSELTWLGLAPETVTILAPHVSILPAKTLINLNTSSAEVLSAAINGLDITTARLVLSKRNKEPWITLESARQAMGENLGKNISDDIHGVKSNFFEVKGRMQYGDLAKENVALILRDSGAVKILWRLQTAYSMD